MTNDVEYLAKAIRSAGSSELRGIKEALEACSKPQLVLFQQAPDGKIKRDPLWLDTRLVASLRDTVTVRDATIKCCSVMMQTGDYWELDHTAEDIAHLIRTGYWPPI
jgi:hypothetical protein